MTHEAYAMTRIAPTVSAILRLPAPARATDTPISQIVADFPDVCPVILLALDAFGEYAWKLWREEMPFLRALHAQRSITLRAVMPTITPVNFATMVSGTDMTGHGVQTLHDHFTCETLFDVVRRAEGRSAGIGLNGYTGSELLGRYADICGNAGNGTDDAVTEKIIECADGDRPAFIIAQLGELDHVFHQYGPSSPAMVPMLRATDARVKRLVEHLKRLGYGVLILADHGQHDVVGPREDGMRGLHGTDMPEDCLVPCTWV